MSSLKNPFSLHPFISIHPTRSLNPFINPFLPVQAKAGEGWSEGPVREDHVPEGTPAGTAEAREGSSP